MKKLNISLLLLLLGSVNVGAEMLDDAPPYYAEFTAPEYPQAEKPYGTEGKVAAKIMVGISGDVASVEITESEPQGLFDQAVLDATRKWKFHPRCKQGFQKPFVVTKAFVIQRAPYVGARAEIIVEANIHEPMQNLEAQRSTNAIQLKLRDPCAELPAGQFKTTGTSTLFASPAHIESPKGVADSSVFRVK